MVRVHKYIRKYLNKKGKWTYVYKSKRKSKNREKTDAFVVNYDEIDEKARQAGERFIREQMKRIKTVDERVRESLPKGI